MEISEKTARMLVGEWEDVEYDVKHGMADSYRYDGEFEDSETIERWFYTEYDCGFGVATNKNTGEVYAIDQIDVYDDDMNGYVRYTVDELRDFIDKNVE
jgi:hypothetical protein